MESYQNIQSDGNSRSNGHNNTLSSGTNESNGNNGNEFNSDQISLSCSTDFEKQEENILTLSPEASAFLGMLPDYAFLVS